ncbi:unnamed protein product, partial [Caenorhabditis brenneri]
NGTYCFTGHFEEAGKKIIRSSAKQPHKQTNKVVDNFYEPMKTGNQQSALWFSRKIILSLAMRTGTMEINAPF